MKFKFVIGALLALTLVVTPVFTNAQTVAELQALINQLLHQIGCLQNPSSCGSIIPPPPPTCQYTQDLAFGSGGTKNPTQAREVSILQQMLLDAKLFGAITTSPSGYFGAGTAYALGRWQVNNGISELDSAGRAMWGWQSRKIACAGPVHYPISASVVANGQSATDSITIRQGDSLEFYAVPNIDLGLNYFTDYTASYNFSDLFTCGDGGHTGAAADLDYRKNSGQKWSLYCKANAVGTGSFFMQAYKNGETYGSNVIKVTVVPNQNTGVAINSVSGPASLAVGQQGTWKVTVTAPADAMLTYTVEWGDDKTFMPLSQGYDAATAVKNTGTFTHTYSQPGTYTVQISVANDNQKGGGNPVKTTLGVVVGTPSNNSGDAYIVGTPTLTINQVYDGMSGGSAYVQIEAKGILNSKGGDSYVDTNSAGLGFYIENMQGKKNPDNFNRAVIVNAPIVTGSYDNKYYHLKEGVNVSFTSKIVYKTDHLFSGMYNGRLNSLYYVKDLKSGNIENYSVGPYKSPATYIVGEQGPYISSVVSERYGESGFNYKIMGERLSNGINTESTVYLNGEKVYSIYVTLDKSIRFNSNKPLSAGSYPVYVTNAVGKSNVKYLEVGGQQINPYISSLSVNSGKPGTSVTVYGSNFLTSVANQVTFSNPSHDNGVPGVTSSDGKSFKFIVPSLEPSIYSIAIENSAGKSSNFVPFTITPATIDYNTCRLDKLNGTNITRRGNDEITSQSDCLSKVCDIYGPANLKNGIESKCLYQGTEIKRYTKIAVPCMKITCPAGTKWTSGGVDANNCPVDQKCVTEVSESSLRVTSPANGSSFMVGEPITFSWSKVSPTDSPVNIFLRSNTDTTKTYSITKLNSGSSYNWKGVSPVVPPGSYRVVASMDGIFHNTTIINLLPAVSSTTGAVLGTDQMASILNVLGQLLQYIKP